MHHRRQIAHVLREFLADTANTAQQLAVLLKIDHRNQPIAYFHPQRIFQLDIGPAGLGGLRILRHHRRLHRFRRLLFTAAQPPGQAQQSGGKQQEHQVRHTRHQAQQPQYPGAQQHHARIVEQLAHHLLTDVLIGRDAGDDNAGGGGDHQRRDLRHQTVTDGQQRIAFRRRPQLHTMLHDTDQQAADDVQHHDHQAGNGIATHEFTGTVH